MASGNYSGDPNIIVNYDAIREINDIFKTYNPVKPNLSFNAFVLYAMDSSYIDITYECEFDNIFKFFYKHTTFVCTIKIPPSRLGVSKNEIEILWEGLELLEKEGWHYDKKFEDFHYSRYVCDFPPPEERQKLIDLLKKVYSFPLTKACK